MSRIGDLASRLIASHAETLSGWKEEQSRLREVSRPDREPAAEDRYCLTLRSLIAEANALYTLYDSLLRAYRHHWYDAGGDYTARDEEACLENVRDWESSGADILDEIADLEARGRDLEGIQAFRDNMSRARDLLAEDIARIEASAMMPALDRLDRLADAHLRRPSRIS